MNNYALVAALGTDAVAAVRGYRLQVISQAQRRGLSLVSEALSDVVQLPVGALLVAPINIRLIFLHNPDRIDLAGRMLKWNPAHGWSLSRGGAYAPLSYYAGSDATALDLVPTAAQVIEWATSNPSAPRARVPGRPLALSSTTTPGRSIDYWASSTHTATRGCIKPPHRHIDSTPTRCVGHPPHCTMQLTTDSNPQDGSRATTANRETFPVKF